MCNIWSQSNVSAGDDLIFKLEKLPFAAKDGSIKYHCNHWKKAIAVQQFKYEEGGVNEGWQIVPAVLSTYAPARMHEGYDYRQHGYWHIARSQIMARNESSDDRRYQDAPSTGIYHDDRASMRGALVEGTFEPVWVEYWPWQPQRGVKRVCECPCPGARKRVPRFGGGGGDGGGDGGDGGGGDGGGGDGGDGGGGGNRLGNGPPPAGILRRPRLPGADGARRRGGGGGGLRGDGMIYCKLYPPSHSLIGGSGLSAEELTRQQAAAFALAEAAITAEELIQVDAAAAALAEAAIAAVVSPDESAPTLVGGGLGGVFSAPVKKPRRSLGLAVGLSNLAAGGSVMVETVKGGFT
jgi:hypothetical protein